jgi:hypothetical protein
MCGVSPLQRLDTVAIGVLGLLQQRGNRQVAGAARGVKMAKRKGWSFEKAAAAVSANAEYQNAKIAKLGAKQPAPKAIKVNTPPVIGDGLNDLRAALNFNRKAAR